MQTSSRSLRSRSEPGIGLAGQPSLLAMSTRRSRGARDTETAALRWSSPLAAHAERRLAVVQHRLTVAAAMRGNSPTTRQVVEVPRRVGEDELVAACAADLAGGDERRPAPSLGSVRAPVSRSFRGRPAAHRSIGLERDESGRIGGIGLIGEAFATAGCRVMGLT